LIFRTKTKSLLPQAKLYSELLVVTERGSRNIEAMSGNLPSNDYHRIQHFISESPWSARELMDSVAKDINDLFKNEKSVGLIIDESSEEKKGEKSVGVAHQYCGTVGKQANCQVAVFATLCAGEHFSLIDAQLYFPQEWTNNPKRMEKAGVPKDTVYKKKTAIALEIVKRQKEAGIRIDYVAADALYGHDSEFRAGLDELGILFVLDVHKDIQIFEQEFQIEVPAKKPGRGKTPIKAKPNQKSKRVDKYMADLTDKDWSTVVLRNGCKGALVSQVHAKEIYVNENDTCVKRTLIIRKTKQYKTTVVHFILSNGSLEEFTKEMLAEYQSQRFYIEQSFREAKQNIGMCDYQVRGWLAWNHHIALSLMALAFFTMEKKEHEAELPLLSYRDIRDAIIDNFIQEQKPLPFEEKMAIRHRQRQSDINRHYRKKSNVLK